MAKWVVSFRVYNERLYRMKNVEAKDGKEAIKIVNSKIIGASMFEEYRDDEAPEDGCLQLWKNGRLLRIWENGKCIRIAD